MFVSRMVGRLSTPSVMTSATQHSREIIVSAAARLARWRRTLGWWTSGPLSMPPGPPIAATPGVHVGVLRFDQAQADQSPVLIHPLDRVAVQLQLADHGRWGIKPSRTQRGKRHRLLTSTTQLLKRQTMLGLN